MPKPRRRRRFFALEGRFEMNDAGEPDGIIESAQDDSSADSVSSTESKIAPEEADLPPSIHKEPPVAADSSEDDELPPAFRLNRTSRVRPAPQRLFSGGAVLLGLLGIGSGLLAGYLFARSGQKPAGTDLTRIAPISPVSLNSADASELDGAYAARHAHQYDEAEKIFGSLNRRHPDWGPVEVELGRTFFYANKPYDAIMTLRTAAEKGWKPAEANFLLGVLNNTRKSYPEAEQYFARAVALDPTQPDYYFFWGECLREQGRLLDATAKFQSALLRNQYETATGLYRAKLWLCAVEADQEANNGIKAEIDEELKLPHPAMEAYIATAARDIKAGDFGAAAAHLSRARRRADQTVFRYIVNDPLFAPVRMRPEFASIFQPAMQAPVEAAVSPAPSASPAKTEKP